MSKIPLILINLFIVYVSCSKLRGVSQERLSLYDEKKPFACLDGSGVIDFEMVNDDYCDCRDGSDEPGTAACIFGTFTCANLGFMEHSIPSSRVNDGICDCCDGSDEYDGKKTCESTCDSLAKKRREEQEKTKKLLQSGLEKKKELLEKGFELRKSLEAKLQDLESYNINIEIERNRLEEIKNLAESKAKEATDEEDRIHEEEAKKQAEIEKEQKSNRLFESLDTDKNEILSAEELVTHNELDILFDNDNQFTLDEAKRFLDHKEDVDKKYFYENYYEKLLPHIVIVDEQHKELSKPLDEPQKHDESPHSDEQSDNHEDEHDNNNNNEQEEAHEHNQYEDNENNEENYENKNEEHDYETTTEKEDEKQTEPTKIKSKYNEHTNLLIEAAERAKRAFKDAENKLNSIQNEMNSIKKKLSYDVGPNYEYFSMIDECFDFDDREYTYRFCPFERTVQKSKSNSGETPIGVWSSWDDNNKYKIMLFTNGLVCWNGPARSTKVYILCGLENKVIAVSEPNRCEYEMKFETPLACHEADLNKAMNADYEHNEL